MSGRRRGTAASSVGAAYLEEIEPEEGSGDRPGSTPSRFERISRVDQNLGVEVQERGKSVARSAEAVRHQRHGGSVARRGWRAARRE